MIVRLFETKIKCSFFLFHPYFNNKIPSLLLRSTALPTEATLVHLVPSVATTLLLTSTFVHLVPASILLSITSVPFSVATQCFSVAPRCFSGISVAFGFNSVISKLQLRLFLMQITEKS